MSRHRTIVLVGLSGTGKSSVGRELAARLGRPLLDTDALIVAAAGQSAAEIFANEGEARFRDRETIALRQALSGGGCVLATGAGIILRDENRALLREQPDVLVIWLDAPTEALVARLQAHDEERPLLAGDPTARLEAQRAIREPLYATTATLRIDTGGGSIAQLAADIIAALDQ